MSHLTPAYDDGMARLYLGDAMEVLGALPQAQAYQPQLIPARRKA